MARRQRLVLAAPLVALVAVVTACVPSPPPGGPPPPHVISVGHIDAVHVAVESGVLKLRISDDTISPPVLRDPAQTLLHAKPESQTSVPNPPGNFAFLGAGGAPVWILPQVQNPILLWPGASTEAIGGGVLQGNQVTWWIDSVSGPGGFHIYSTNGFGVPTVRFTTNQAFPQSLVLPVGTHAHYNWAFGATGTYTVVMRATATLANGTPVTTGPVTYSFRVGPL